LPVAHDFFELLLEAKPSYLSIRGKALAAPWQ
jgi:hypothetical protein